MYIRKLERERISKRYKLLLEGISAYDREKANGFAKKTVACALEYDRSLSGRIKEITPETVHTCLVFFIDTEITKLKILAKELLPRDAYIYLCFIDYLIISEGL